VTARARSRTAGALRSRGPAPGSPTAPSRFVLSHGLFRRSSLARPGRSTPRLTAASPAALAEGADATPHAEREGWPVSILLSRWSMTARSTPDVRVRCLAGARLPSASLAGLDLRGADLTGADLTGADLSRIRSGMSRGWAVLLASGSLLLSIALGALVGICVRALHLLYASEDVRRRFVALFVVAALLVFLVAGIWRCLRFATRNVLPVTAALAVAAGLIAVITGAGTGAGGLAALVFLALAAIIVALSVLVRAVAGTVGKLVFSMIAIAGGLAGGAMGGGLTASVVAVGAMLMARRSARVEAAYPVLARTCAAIASRGGTRFRNANLAGANLAEARLVACDFRGANLAGARFDRATLRLCRFDPGVTIPPG
jgi:pentapeptide repeat protein